MGAIKTIRQSTSAELEWFCRGLSYAPHMDLKGLTGIDSKGLVVALVGFDGWTHGSVCLHSWISQGALTRAFMREVARYPFNTGRKVLIGKTAADNAKALKFNKHYGFKEVYRIRDGFADGVDLVIQELRQEDCRWYKKDGNGNTSTTPASGPPDRSETAAPSGLCPTAAKPATAGNDPGSSATADGSVRRCPASDGATPGRSAAAGGDGSSVSRDGSLAGWEGGRPADARKNNSNAPGAGCASSAAATGTVPDESCCHGSRNADAPRPHVARRWYSAGLMDGRDEDVSLEPWRDVKAQIDDMLRIGSKRKAVWLSERNWKQYRHRLLEYYPLVRDLDGQGGTLLCRTHGVAQEAYSLTADGADVRAVVGRLICAGEGKPQFTPDAVVAQMLDNSGAVARESIQPSRVAGFGKIIEWLEDYQGGQAQLVTLEQVLERRASLVNPNSCQHL